MKRYLYSRYFVSFQSGDAILAMVVDLDRSSLTKISLLRVNDYLEEVAQGKTCITNISKVS